MSDPASTARFELPPDDFDDMVAARGLAVYRLDLAPLLPDLFVNSARMPRALRQTWREVLDAQLAIDPGICAFRGGSAIDIAFYDLPAAAARSRLRDIGNEITRRIAPPLPESAGAAAGEVVDDAKISEGISAIEAELARLVREGIGRNPGAETMRLWASREALELRHLRRALPMTTAMLDLVSQSDVSYTPFFDVEAGAIAGSSCQVQQDAEPAHYNSGEIFRQDLAALFAAAVQLYYMQGQRRDGLIIIAARAQTLADADVAGLYCSFVGQLPREIANSLVVDIQGLPEGKLPLTMQAAVGAVSNAVRSCMFDIHPLRPSDPLREYPVLHACGFSLSLLRQEKNWQRAARKFADFYSGLRLRSFIRDVETAAEFNAARGLGFSYVMGSAVGTAQKTAIAAKISP